VTARQRQSESLRTWPNIVAFVVALVCLPAAAAVAVVATNVGHDTSVEQARAAAVSAATSAARDILSYDYRTLGTDIPRAKAETTGLFASQYASTSDQLLAQAKQLRAIVQARPAQPGVVSATTHQVVVLLFVDQLSVKQVAGAKTPTTRIDQSRVRLTMSKVGGRWLVSQLAAL
jgi:Mce-associated membrane protein